MNKFRKAVRMLQEDKPLPLDLMVALEKHGYNLEELERYADNGSVGEDDGGTDE